MSLFGIEAIGASGLAAPQMLQLGGLSGPNLFGPNLSGPMQPIAPRSASFADMLLSGLQKVDGKVADAEGLARRFAIDDSVPIHQVTMALEEARLSVELAMQVRARLVEGYREMMNMQL